MPRSAEAELEAHDFMLVFPLIGQPFALEDNKY